MRLLICGDRNWQDRSCIKDWIEHAVREYHGNVIVIHGAARGADTIAGLAAKANSLEVIEFPAEWSKYHRAAGVIRNAKMLLEGNPDAVWAFHDKIEESKGTADMIRRALRAGLPVRLITKTDSRVLRG